MFIRICSLVVHYIVLDALEMFEAWDDTEGVSVPTSIGGKGPDTSFHAQHSSKWNIFMKNSVIFVMKQDKVAQFQTMSSHKELQPLPNYTSSSSS